jgi:predicted enzyme related to lactoylglutathione lyase
MPTFVHMDIAAEDPERARDFYEKCFGWRIQPTDMDYYLFYSSGLAGEPGVGGGIGKRMDPTQRITAYIGVDSIEKYADKIIKEGGKQLQPKMTVPGMGYLANFKDTEGNVFGLWQPDPGAKQ